MKLSIEWLRPIVLRGGTRENLIYTTDVNRLPDVAGLYVLGRRWGSQFEALYVGKANRIRGRVKGQMNHLRLMPHLKSAKAGKRVVLCGKVRTRPGQRMKKCKA